MRDRVSYEWTVEEIDQHGDIQDVDFDDNLERMAEEFRNFEPHSYTQGPMKTEVRIVEVRLGLLKRYGNEYDGSTYRTYAYLIESVFGWTMSTFDDGQPVNKSHLKMIEKACQPKPKTERIRDGIKALLN